MPDRESQIENEPHAHRGVLCAKCEHLNPPGRNVCDHCGAHLYVVCHACGHRNIRVLSRCAHCQHRLHRSFSGRLFKKAFGPRKMTFIQLILFLLGVALGFLLILFLAEFRLPNPF